MYAVRFYDEAETEWRKLDNGIRNRFLTVLERRLAEPRIVSAQLRADLKGLYKIKLQKTGHRLVYEVVDDELLILIVAVGGHSAYRKAASRFR